MQNPYLPQQAQAITDQVTNNLQRKVLPGINQNAMATGGFGGSRQGIAQGLAIGETNQGLSNSLANLYGNAWAQDQQNEIARTGQNMGFYTSQRGQDLQQMGLGANLMQSGNQGLQAGGMGMYQAGQMEQQAPLNALQSYAGMLSPFTGLNQTTSQTQPGPSTAGSVLGGALTAAQIWQLLAGGGK